MSISKHSDIPSPALILIRGLPGSGKSYLATTLRDTLGPERVTILDPDTIDTNSQAYKDLCAGLTAEDVDPKFFPNRFLKAQGYQAIDAGHTIIWNQAFTDLGGLGRSSQSLIDYAAERGVSLPMLIVEMEVSPATAKARIAERAGQGGHDVSTENFTRFINDYRSFADEGYNTVTVSGESNIDISVATVLEALQRLV
ncbi:MAG TPA: ATP-binding protein [Candidatus Saccharimonadales bacterium]|nr:ATP-binding protein [Candidatus Saccharimonadales bacterium]